MRRSAIISLLAILMLLASIYAPTFALETTENGTQLFVDPASVTLAVDSTFTIAVKITDIASFAGFDIKLAWDPAILEHTEHTVMVPVEDFTGGVLHEPIFTLKDEVDPTAGIYWCAIAHLGTTSFDGSGTVFEITFHVLAEGFSDLAIIGDDLANVAAEPIEHVTSDGYFTTGTTPPPEEHDIAVTNVSPSPTNVFAGTPITIGVTVDNQGDFPETFDITAYYGSTMIGTTDGALAAGASNTFNIVWNTAGVAPNTYTIRAEATLVEVDDDDPADNSRTDGTVTIKEEAPPPPVGAVIIDWANFSWSQHPCCGDPAYPFGGEFHNGEYPVWKNFTVINGGSKNILYVSIRYPETTPAFKPSVYYVCVLPENELTCDWIINVNLADRLVEFTAEDRGIPAGGCGTFSVKFIEGPTVEDCIVGHEFAVTYSDISCIAETVYLKEFIDKTAPEVTITFPDAPSPGGQGYSFKKGQDGNIWVQMPNGTVKSIKWLWINGTASDACSGINRVEIWANNTCMGDATLSGPVGSKNVRWWWHIDPSNNPSFWEHESWFNVTARAYDNSVNDLKTIAPHCHHPKLPKTNSKDDLSWIFWIGSKTDVYAMQFHKHIDWVPANGRLDVNGSTGFYPNGEVKIYLESAPVGDADAYDISILLATITADNHGRFYYVVNHLPEVPRKPASNDLYYVRATDNKTNTGSDYFYIIPWITYEPTLPQDGPEWTTTKQGHVGDTINVYGHGFLPSQRTGYDQHTTVTVQIWYTDVAPLQSWDSRRVFNGTCEHKMNILQWYPRLSEVVLATATTNANGYWSAQITIPQSYGGLHAIYAVEYSFITSPGFPSPPMPSLERSGWLDCTDVPAEEQAVIFDVWPTIKVTPSTAIKEQYVTITGEGLPLPKYYELWKDDVAIYPGRDWCLVLDFGPFDQWIFENKRILNNQLDMPWATGFWYPFSFYSPDPMYLTDNPESLIWHGKLCSVLFDYGEYEPDNPLQPWMTQIHLGSQYLQVPILAPGDYEVMLYYYDKDAGDFTHDHHASTAVTVLSDPLNIGLQVGNLHFAGEIVTVLAQVNVDGIEADATTLTLELYEGDTLVQTLTTTKVETGLYSATFTCPDSEGDYFVKASATKSYEYFTLAGVAISGFAVSPTLSGMNPILLSLNETIGTIKLDTGQILVDLADLDAKIVDIEDGVATISTTVGQIKTTLDNLKANITKLEQNIVTANTAIGELRADLTKLNGIVEIKNDVATIKTDLGDITGRVTSLEGNTATIQTAVGTIKTSVEDSARVIPASVGLSLIAALAAIAAAVLLLRKVYLK